MYLLSSLFFLAVPFKDDDSIRVVGWIGKQQRSFLSSIGGYQPAASGYVTMLCYQVVFPSYSSKLFFKVIP